MRTQVLDEYGNIIEKSDFAIIPNHGDKIWHDCDIYTVDYCEFDFVDNVIQVFTHEG